MRESQRHTMSTQMVLARQPGVKHYSSNFTTKAKRRVGRNDGRIALGRIALTGKERRQRRFAQSFIAVPFVEVHRIEER